MSSINKGADREVDKLPGDYIAGFVDGEGCFYLHYRSEIKRNRKGQPVYYRWVPYFAIVLREDDREILEKMQVALDCGTISKSRDQVRYNVQNVDDIVNKIIPFFNTYVLHAKKRNDFILWSKAASIVYKKFHNKQKYNGSLYTKSDHQVLSAIRDKMKIYKSKKRGEYSNRPRF